RAARPRRPGERTGPRAPGRTPRTWTPQTRTWTPQTRTGNRARTWGQARPRARIAARARTWARTPARTRLPGSRATTPARPAVRACAATELGSAHRDRHRHEVAGEARQRAGMEDLVEPEPGRRGFGPLERVDHGSGGVGQASGQQQPHHRPAATGMQLGHVEDRHPA